MLVEIKNLVKRYDYLLALDHVDLSIEEGEIYGLLGPNGAGKSTLINAIVGLIKNDDGEINLFNQGTGKDRLIKKNIGIVPQEIAIFQDLAAQENLIFFGKLYGLQENCYRSE